MPVSVITLSNREPDLEFTKAVAERNGFDFSVAATKEELEQIFAERPQCLVFWDIEDSRFAHNRFLPLISKAVKPKHVFALSNFSIFELPEVNRVTSVGHYCVRNYSDFAVDWIAKLCYPLFSPEPFGLEYYNDPAAKTTSVELASSHQKEIALKGFTKVLLAKGIHPRAVDMVAKVIDELIMNAVFDAPMNAEGVHYRREVARDSEFTLEGRERVTISMALNPSFVSIGVKDHFGSFSNQNAFEALRRDHSKMDYKPKADTLSGGLGLQQIAASGMGVMISWKQGIATEVVICFPYYKSFKETKVAFRSFSFNTGK